MEYEANSTPLPVYRNMTPESVLQYPQTTLPAPGETFEISPGVHWLRMPLPFALDHINLWLLEDEGGWCIVDCGYGNDATRALWDKLFSGRIAGRPVTRVIVTHHHPDHAGNAAWLLARSGAQFWMSQTEYLAAHALHDDQAGFGFEKFVTLYTKNGLGAEYLEKMQARRGSYRRGTPELPVSYRRLIDGQIHRIGKHSWRVISGYGHSPEHAALYCEESGVLISGDMVLPKISTNVSVQVIEPEGNPLALFLSSLERYVSLPADTLILPSHGLPFRGVRERIAQLQEHHRLRLNELHEACDTPKSAADVIATLFRRVLDTQQLFFAMGESMAHLHYLHAEGRLARIDGADGVIRYVRT